MYRPVNPPVMGSLRKP